MKSLVLIGNPNTGKTTLFNVLTNSNEHASNWHGVTVSVKKKVITYFGQKIEIVDLPGIGSLSHTSPDEKIAIKEIENYLNKKNSIFVLVCDAGNLNKNLFLAYQLKECNIKFVLVLNMINEVKLNIDLVKKKLTDEFNCLTLTIDCRRKKAKYKLLDIKLDIKNSEEVIKNLRHFINYVKNGNELKNAEITYKKITNLHISDCFNQVKTEKSDFLLSFPKLSLPLFFLLFCFAFFLIFGPVGSLLSDFVEDYFVGFVFDFIVIKAYNISGLFGDFLNSVLVVGVGSVICFLPQIVMLFLFLSLIEDSGIMSRISFLIDPFFRKFGLTGKSVFSIMSGFGCTTSSVLVSRNLENSIVRKKTIFVLPFVGCSAKLPIILVVSSLFFGKLVFLVLIGLYLISLFVCLFILKLSNIKLEHQPFLLEIPRLRIPYFKKVIADTKYNVFSFASRTLGIVALLCSLLFFLSNFDFYFRNIAGTENKSILEVVAGFFAPIFKPLGFGFFGVVVALFFGLVAKEMIVSVLAMINGVGAGMLGYALLNPASEVFFSLPSAVSFVVFIFLFSPCFPCLSMIRKEIGLKSAIFCFVFQFFLAYLLSLFVYQILIGNFIFLWIFVSLLFALLGWSVLKLRKRKGQCDGCKNKFCSFRRKL